MMFDTTHEDGLATAFRYVSGNAEALCATPDAHFTHQVLKLCNYDEMEKWPWQIRGRATRREKCRRGPRPTPRLLAWVRRVADECPARHWGFNGGEPSKYLAIAIICGKLGISYWSWRKYSTKLRAYEAQVRALEFAVAPRDHSYGTDRWLDGLLGL